MMTLLLLIASFFQTPAEAPAVAATSGPELANMVNICQETCYIEAVSSTTAVAQFGVGSTWCLSNVTLTTLPLTVNYGTPNTLLCPNDPAFGLTKWIAFQQQQTTSYTVTWSTTPSGATTTTTIPALAPAQSCAMNPSQTGCMVTQTFPATCTSYSDKSFSCVATGQAVLNQ